MDAKQLLALLKVELVDGQIDEVIGAIVVLIAICQLHLHRADTCLIRVNPNVLHRTVLEDISVLAFA